LTLLPAMSCFKPVAAMPFPEDTGLSPEYVKAAVVAAA
jgi:hypothetical protein